MMLICRFTPGRSAVQFLLLRFFPGAFWLLSRWKLVVSRFDGYLASFGNLSTTRAALKILSWSSWLLSRLLKFSH